MRGQRANTFSSSPTLFSRFFFFFFFLYIMSRAGTEQTCTVLRKGEGKSKRSKNAQGAREHERGKGDFCREEMRRSQKTKGALQAFQERPCEVHPCVYIITQPKCYSFDPGWLDEPYRFASLRRGPRFYTQANNVRADLNLISNRNAISHRTPRVRI